IARPMPTGPPPTMTTRVCFSGAGTVTRCSLSWCATVRRGVVMPRRIALPFRLLIPILIVVALAGTIAAQSSSTSPPASPALAGVRVLNPALTQKPDEIGFNPDWAYGGPGGGSGGKRRGGGSGTGGSGAGGAEVPRARVGRKTRVEVV